MWLLRNVRHDTLDVDVTALRRPKRSEAEWVPSSPGSIVAAVAGRDRTGPVHAAAASGGTDASATGCVDGDACGSEAAALAAVGGLVADGAALAHALVSNPTEIAQNAMRHISRCPSPREA